MAKHVIRAEIRDTVGVIYSQEQADAIVEGYPEHEKDARAKGVPVLGSGRIFPIAESEISCKAFDVPDHWARIGALDFGWDHPTAAVSGVHDRDADCLYLTACYKAAKQTPVIHSAALKPWGEDMPWAWPMDGWNTAGKQGTKPGKPYKDAYVEHGLHMLHNHAQFEGGSTSVEAGLIKLLERMQTGRLKVFDHLTDWFDEFRLYHRKDGLVVKEYDDLMDATRYLLMSLRHAEVPSSGQVRERRAPSSQGWMG